MSAVRFDIKFFLLRCTGSLGPIVTLYNPLPHAFPPSRRGRRLPGRRLRFHHAFPARPLRGRRDEIRPGHSRNARQRDVFPPTLGGQPFTHKPPIHFWLIDLLTFPLGTYSMWAFVLPSLIAFALLLWLLWRRGGPLAAFVCATSLLMWASAQTARMDVSFTLLIAYGLLKIEDFFDRDDFRALLLCAAALGVATLIKGPMAPVIGLVLFALEWWRRRRAPRGNYLPALAALVLIPLAWFVPAMLLGGHAYTREVIVKQTVGRAVATWVHAAPPWFYVLHLPATLFPWFFL